jgi:hypothetical protein
LNDVVSADWEWPDAVASSMTAATSNDIKPNDLLEIDTIVPRPPL